MLKRRGFDSPEINRTVERQLRNWELARSQRLRVPTQQRSEVADFISISREVGAGASELASELATRLNWPKFDKEILQEMTGDDATRHRVYQSMDERDLGWWEESLKPILEPDFVRNDYFRRLVKTALSLARQGSAVFLGRGIDCMLPHGLGFRVRIVSPLEMRVERFAKRHNISIEKASKIVPEIDRERAEFVANHFHARVDDATRCDLTLNTEHFSPTQATDAILLVRDIMKAAPRGDGEPKPTQTAPSIARVKKSNGAGGSEVER